MILDTRQYLNECRYTLHMYMCEYIYIYIYKYTYTHICICTLVAVVVVRRCRPPASPRSYAKADWKKSPRDLAKERFMDRKVAQKNIYFFLTKQAPTRLGTLLERCISWNASQIRIYRDKGGCKTMFLYFGIKTLAPKAITNSCCFSVTKSWVLVVQLNDGCNM